MTPRPETAPGATYGYRTLSEPVREQLARHLASTEGLYRQVLNLPSPTPARPILKAELALSGLKESTPRLRADLAREPAEARRPVQPYLDKAEEMVRDIEVWVGADGRPIRAIRDELAKQGDLLVQIEKLRSQYASRPARPATFQVVLPPEAARDPAIRLYLAGRQQYYQGNPGGAVFYFRTFEKQFPDHELSGNARYWKAFSARMSGVSENQLELELRWPMPPEMPFGKERQVVFRRQGGGYTGIEVDGQLHALADPAGAIEVYYRLWSSGETEHLLLGAEVRRGEMEDGEAWRHIVVRWKRTQAGNSPRALALLHQLQAASGVETSDVFPKVLAISARERHFPRHEFPPR